MTDRHPDGCACLVCFRTSDETTGRDGSRSGDRLREEAGTEGDG